MEDSLFVGLVHFSWIVFYTIDELPNLQLDRIKGEWDG